jgi:hypothetical protein
MNSDDFASYRHISVKNRCICVLPLHHIAQKCSRSWCERRTWDLTMNCCYWRFCQLLILKVVDTWRQCPYQILFIICGVYDKHEVPELVILRFQTTCCLNTDYLVATLSFLILIIMVSSISFRITESSLWRLCRHSYEKQLCDKNSVSLPWIITDLWLALTFT